MRIGMKPGMRIYAKSFISKPPYCRGEALPLKGVAPDQAGSMANQSSKVPAYPDSTANLNAANSIACSWLIVVIG